MLFQVVHTIGSTVYFLFFILFICACLVPRANPGAGWWALAILCALLSRLSYFILHPDHGISVTMAVYASVNAMEKLFLAIGMIRFIKQEKYLYRLGFAAVAVEVWILCAHLFAADGWVFWLGLSIYNVGVLFLVGVLAFNHHQEVPHRLMQVSAITCYALVVHWLATFVLLRLFPSWEVIAFLIGTTLVLTLYLSLITGILTQLYHRLIQAEAKALDLAYLDPLTGLNNKRCIDVLFEQVLMLTNRANQMLAILYIDLDKFKPINDTCGHKVGDFVLQEIAKRLKENLRTSDICARIGGDEFVIILTQIKDENFIPEITEKLLKQLEKPIDVNGDQYRLGASIGVSIYPQHGDDLADLLDKADQAMYQVKQNGRNGYMVYA